MRKRGTQYRRHRQSISRRPWKSLTPGSQETRKRSLSVLSKMRQGLTLSFAAKEVGIDSRTVTRHLGNALTKRRGKYHAKQTDRISRSMVIYSQGRQLTITFVDSKTASTIGKYLNAVRQYLNTGDKSALKPFENVDVVDSDGNTYRIETDSKRIQAIEDAKEDREFFDPYGRG